MQSGFNVPVNVGDELDVTIEAVGEKGDGIAKVKGFVLFVPDVKEGERCRIKVNKVLKKVGFAEKIGKAETKEEPKPEAVEMPPERERPQYEDTENFGEEAEDSEDDSSDEEDSDSADEGTEDSEDEDSEKQ